MPHKTIGLIGVGLVGTALAERFLAADWQVIGFDLQTENLNRLQSLKGQVAGSAAEVFAACDTVVLSLPTSEIVAQVLATLDVSITGILVVDTTTGEPDEMLAMGQGLATRGAHYLDATIAGSSAQVRAGDVIVMVGGEPDAVARCDDLFRSFASRTFHVGPWGAGARMKLVVNLVLGLNRAVLAEGLCFAERTGVDPRLALEVLRAGPAFSRVMDTKAGKMLDGDFIPQARLAQHLKDVRLILETGAAHQARLPLSMLHAELLEELDEAGYGDLDNSAIVKVFQNHKGVGGNHEIPSVG